MHRTSARQKVTLILFGVFLCVALFEVGLRTGGYVFKIRQDRRNRASLRQNGTYRILCLGESTTALGGSNSWPRHLERILNKQKLGIKFSVINKGIIGTNTGIIVSLAEGHIGKYNPDMVIAMMGINDRADTVVYEDIAENKNVSFLNLFKTFKLGRLLQQRITTRARETKIDALKENIAGEETPYQKYVKLGIFYAYRGDYDKGEEMLKKAIETEPYSHDAYVELGWLYEDLGRPRKAREMFEKAIDTNPENDELYVEISWWYGIRGEYDTAEKMLKKAIEINPKNDEAYVELGWWYSNMGMYDKAEKMFEKTIEINPKNYRAYAELGWYYREKKEYDKAEEMLKKVMEINPENDEFHQILAQLYEERGERKLAEGFFASAERLRSKVYNPITRHNYHKLKEIVTRKGIKLVSAQYPMRHLEPLKAMLAPHGDILFVDNEIVFKNVLKNQRHDEYFVDMFGGDFGHLTAKGNKLLAQNIADVILKECFNK